MGIIELIFTSFGLAMDASAVSMSNGMTMKKQVTKNALILGLAFGLFQGIMPIIGYLAGNVFSEYMSAIDHWIALTLLSFIGIKMLIEAFKHDDEAKSFKLDFKLIIIQSIATSVDALAVGVSLSALKFNIITASISIALITFVCSFISVFIGKKFGDILNKKSAILGGCILIAIGLKIFIEHVFFKN